MMLHAVVTYCNPYIDLRHETSFERSSSKPCLIVKGGAWGGAVHHSWLSLSWSTERESHKTSVSRPTSYQLSVKRFRNA